MAEGVGSQRCCRVQSLSGQSTLLQGSLIQYTNILAVESTWQCVRVLLVAQKRCKRGGMVSCAPANSCGEILLLPRRSQVRMRLNRRRSYRAVSPVVSDMPEVTVTVSSVQWEDCRLSKAGLLDPSRLDFALLPRAMV